MSKAMAVKLGANKIISKSMRKYLKRRARHQGTTANSHTGTANILM
jgi:hypothetical protein